MKQAPPRSTESGIDWEQVTAILENLATSGATKLSFQSLKPFSYPEQALAHIDKIFSALQVLGTGIRPHFESLDLFEPWFTRLKRQAVLKTIELRDVRSFCLECLALQTAVKEQTNSWSQNLQETLMDAEEPLSAIDQLMTPAGEIRSDASEKLHSLFREKDNLIKQISNLLDGLVKSHSMQTFLQDKYVTTREGRWVLPVRSGSQHFVPGVIHGSSQTKQTVFMEPEAIVPVNNRLRQVEVEIEEEIERLLTELSQYLMTLVDDFQITRTLMLEADLLFAQAQWTSKIEGQAFDFSDDEFNLIEVRHPLLMFNGKDPVPNSVRLDVQQSILLLSGPNAGGKTILMKSIGLCAQLARHGMPIPTQSKSRLPFFKNLIVAIGDSQSVGLELSTFAGHLKLLEISGDQKGRDCLILIDEICGATDPEEGSALARAFIERMAENAVYAVVTSHLGPLKGGWAADGHVMNGSLEYDRKSGRPTYHFVQGVPGDSLAIETAKRVGIQDGIIQRALELLSPTSRLRLEQQNQIDQIKSDLNVMKEHLQRETKKMQAERTRFEGLTQALQKDKEKILTDVEKETRKKLDEMISAAKADQVFKKHSTLQDIKTKLPTIVKPTATAQVNSAGPTSAETFKQFYPPGSKVFVSALNADGIVQSEPNGKGEVLVLSNSLRMMVSWSDLKPPQTGRNPTARLVRQTSSFVVPLQNMDRTLDLRGKTVEEALRELEDQIDLAISNQESRVKIIHGHGTDALKKAIRTQLSRSPSVSKWSAGSPEQGGDGVTWVNLQD